LLLERSSWPPVFSCQELLERIKKEGRSFFKRPGARFLLAGNLLFLLFSFFLLEGAPFPPGQELLFSFLLLSQEIFSPVLLATRILAGDYKLSNFGISFEIMLSSPFF